MQRLAIATDARLALLEGLIDHAALYPPASLSMEAALEEDRRARSGAAAFMLGRFVVQASRVGELSKAGMRSLSVVLDAALPTDERIVSVETSPRDELAALAGLAEDVYVELPADEPAGDAVAELAQSGLRAKVRCGGTTTPTVDDLARFIRTCREAEVPFKATAGLHHAVRSGEEHGFLNLLAAVVFGEEERALAEEDAGAFALDAGTFGWRNQEAGPEELRRARERFHAIGSCSFAEPIAELEELGILPLTG